MKMHTHLTISIVQTNEKEGKRKDQRNDKVYVDKVLFSVQMFPVATDVKPQH